MKTIENTTGSKAVNIRKNGTTFMAMFVQRYNGEEQVLESKMYSSEARAINWAKKVLN